MESKPISVTDHTMFVVKTHADLSLQGWDKLEVRAFSDDRHSLNIFQEGDVVRVQSASDLDLTIPVGATVTIERASGDAHIRNLTGHLQLQRVGGDLVVQNIGSAEIISVGGDCMIVGIAGALSIQRIGGDFSAGQLTGSVRLEGIGGDASLQVLNGDVQLRAGGDIQCSLLETGEQSLRADAGGDILLGLPPNAGATLDLRSRGLDIRIELNGENQKIDERLYQGVLGDGSCKINLDCGGDIRITDNTSELQDFHELADELENHWQKQEAERGAHSAEADAAFSFRASEFSERINKQVDEAMRKADSRIQEAMRRLDRHSRRWERHGGFPGNFPFNPPPVPGGGHWGNPNPNEPAEQKPQASSEEKALILKMLEEKKITAEEAEKLLEALEG